MRLGLSRGFLVIGALAALGIVATVALGTIVLRNDGAARQAATLDAARTTTAVFERDVRLILGYANTYLTSIRHAYGAGHTTQAAIDYVRRYPPSADFLSHVTIIDRHGTPIFNSAYPLREGVSVTDRDYFRHFAGGAEDTLFIPPPSIGRNSGKVIVRMVRPLFDADGNFDGVVFVAAPDDAFVRFIDAFAFGDEASATLVGLDHKIRSRNVYGTLGPGQDISGSRIWREIAQSPEGHYRQVSVVDGIERLYTYTVLEDFQMVVALGMPVSGLDGQLSAYQSTVLSFVGFVIVIIILSAVMLIRERYNSQRILDSSQAKSDFLGHMSHELRTPLNSVIGFADIMDQELFGKISPDRYHGYVQNIKASGRHLLALIDDILDLVKVESGKRDIFPVVISPLVEIQACLVILNQDIEARSIRVRLPENGLDTKILFDRTMFRQVCLNLLSNAVKYSLKESTITVTQKKLAGGMFCIGFQDQGPGIATEDLALVMEPFGQSRRNIDTATHGVGLGLPISKLFVERNGGTLELKSEVGVGTSVTIHISAENVR